MTSSDEVGELAQHFNAMLDTLEGSIAAQRQLVADASHELRTPITSLRTNIEVLAESDALPREERERLRADVEEQVAELGALVNDLIELARDIGCLFAIDSDAHAPGQLDFQVYGCARAEELGIDPDRIINTWPTERLLEWSNRAIARH